jgi:phosphate-selective porin OprO/OprP
MKLAPKLLAAAVLAALSTPALAEITIDVVGGSEVSFEGLVQFDYNDFDSDVVNLNGDILDGDSADNELRRAEIVLKGKGPGMFNWVVGYDAKADKFLDTNVNYRFNGSTVLTVGQYKQPNSLEELSSTKNNDFISKAMVTNTFGIARRLGVALGTGGDTWTLTGSVFGRELTRNLAHGSGYGARFTWAPINESGRLFHLGLSAVDYDTDADTVRIRTRPQADLASARLVDTGNLTNTDRQQTLGVEGIWVQGPFKLQAEYMQSTVDRYSSPEDFTGSSGYVSGVWNVTGETWGYKNGVIATNLPDEPASGMWQLGLRYDTIDLDDGTVLGGQMDSWTAGVNWYWRSNTKFSLNYVAVESERRGVQDDPNILEARVQFYW